MDLSTDRLVIVTSCLGEGLCFVRVCIVMLGGSDGLKDYVCEGM